MSKFHNELDSTIWIEQISDETKRVKNGPIYIEKSLIWYERFKRDTENCQNIIEGDWKRFDSRFYLTNIIIGLSILRLYSGLEDEEINNHFITILDTIGIKDYYTLLKILVSYDSWITFWCLFNITFWFNYYSVQAIMTQKELSLSWVVMISW